MCVYIHTYIYIHIFIDCPLVPEVSSEFRASAQQYQLLRSALVASAKAPQFDPKACKIHGHFKLVPFLGLLWYFEFLVREYKILTTKELRWSLRVLAIYAFFGCFWGTT